MKNKTILLLSTLALSTSAFAGTWGHLDFPKNKPYYHSVDTNDKTGQLNLEIACMESFKETRIITLKGLNETVDGSKIVFSPSDVDKIDKKIEGTLSISEDGVVNVITGESATDLVSYFKLLHGVKIEISKGDVVSNYEISLKGSSKSLNIFESKCSKFK